MKLLVFGMLAGAALAGWPHAPGHRPGEVEGATGRADTPTGGAAASSEVVASTPGSLSRAASSCSGAADPEGAAYYAVDLVTTRRLPGSGRATGTASVAFARSPFGVALAEDGSYLYDVTVRLEGLKPQASGTLVAWVTTPEVDHIRRIGSLDSAFEARGRVEWNKFLVVVTLEDRDDPGAATWSGPIAFRGMSRSGMMHTMAGHGPFQQELCAKYGY